MMMNTALALLLAANLLAAGKPVKVVPNGDGRALVVVEGRPGCHAEALYGDPSNPVIVCRQAARR